MENVVVHIISHSHWDREWYLPFESHRLQLVELFDNLFDLFENDPEFKSFHLDESGTKVSYLQKKQRFLPLLFA